LRYCALNLIIIIFCLRRALFVCGFIFRCNGHELNTSVRRALPGGSTKLQLVLFCRQVPKEVPPYHTATLPIISRSCLYAILSRVLSVF